MSAAAAAAATAGVSCPPRGEEERPLAGEVQLLPSLCAGRLDAGDSHTMLATYHIPNYEKKQETDELFNKIMNKARVKLEAGQIITVQWQEDSHICCMKDRGGTLVFCLVATESTYPEGRAHELLAEFAGSVTECPDYKTCAQDGLRTRLAPTMRGLIEKYQEEEEEEEEEEEAAKLQAEEEEAARPKAEAEEAARNAEEARLKAEEKAGLEAEEEDAAKLKAEEEEEAARLKAEEEEAARKAEEARLKAEEEARLKAEEEARLKAEEEEAAKLKAEEEEAARLKAEEEEAARKAEEARLKQARLAEEKRRAEGARNAEEEACAEEEDRIEEERAAERRAEEEARLAEERRVDEETRQAEDADMQKELDKIEQERLKGSRWGGLFGGGKATQDAADKKKAVLAEEARRSEEARRQAEEVRKEAEEARLIGEASLAGPLLFGGREGHLGGRSVATSEAFFVFSAAERARLAEEARLAEAVGELELKASMEGLEISTEKFSMVHESSCDAEATHHRARELLANREAAVPALAVRVRGAHKHAQDALWQKEAAADGLKTAEHKSKQAESEEQHSQRTLEDCQREFDSAVAELKSAIQMKTEACKHLASARRVEVEASRAADMATHDMIRSEEAKQFVRSLATQADATATFAEGQSQLRLAKFPPDPEGVQHADESRTKQQQSQEQSQKAEKEFERAGQTLVQKKKGLQDARGQVERAEADYRDKAQKALDCAAEASAREVRLESARARREEAAAQLAGARAALERARALYRQQEHLYLDRRALEEALSAEQFEAQSALEKAKAAMAAAAENFTGSRRHLAESTAQLHLSRKRADSARLGASSRGVSPIAVSPRRWCRRGDAVPVSTSAGYPSIYFTP